jgi:hypothetical protein
MKEMDNAAERLHNRLNRAVRALNRSRVEYAVIGGNAVGSWLTHTRAGAGIQTRDVDILLRRADLDTAAAALQPEGFIKRDVAGATLFLDGPGARARDAVHVVMANELYRADYLCPSPDVSEVEVIGGARLISRDALTRMKLTSFRSKDRGHLIELLQEGVIAPSMIDHLPEALKERFTEVLREFHATQQAFEQDEP